MLILPKQTKSIDSGIYATYCDIKTTYCDEYMSFCYKMALSCDSRTLRL